MTNIHINNGIQKLRGIENAELQHLRHGNKSNPSALAETQQALANHESPLFEPVDKVELGNSQTISKSTYSPPTSVNPIQFSIQTSQVRTDVVSVKVGDFSTDTADLLIAGKAAKVTVDSSVGIDNGNDMLIVENGAKINLNTSTQFDNSNDLMMIGNGAKVDWNSTVGIDNGNDIVIIGNGAQVSWNSSVGIDNGNDNVIIGNGAKVEFSRSIGVDNGHDTLIVENGAKVKISSVGDTDNESGTLIIGKGADIEITGSLSIDYSKGSGITFLDGKLHIHLINEKNQSFQMEVNVKNKEEATYFQELIRDKIKNGKIHVDGFSNFIQEIQERFREMKSKKNDKLDEPQLKKPEELKPINKHQLRLDMMQSLVQNLFQYQYQANQGLHKGFVRRGDIRI
ncbi:hypothetical protein [Robertmurraya sp.]|uniref:hypothetical protein n=1 Tax=Robertmurraya sp. TaxID=2837525 RepID=UPI003703E207